MFTFFVSAGSASVTNVVVHANVRATERVRTSFARVVGVIRVGSIWVYTQVWSMPGYT